MVVRKKHFIISEDDPVPWLTLSILPHEFSQPQIRKKQMESISFTVKFSLNSTEGKKRLKFHASVILKDNKSYTLIHLESTVLER